ncbi:MAG: molybdopterin-dependent oxidoreductase [Chloroflexi bacterium]|nr:molybdopterin-dependent oxidoreductase [Chloroflexota bacterium]
MSEETKKVICGLCAVHCQYEVRIENGQFLGPDFRKKPDASFMEEIERKAFARCPRAHSAKELVYHPDRLNYPLKRVGERGDGQWERISWKQALDEIAARLEAVKDKYGAETLAIAGGEQNAADEYRLRFQSLFGTPNFLGPMCGCGMVLSSMMSGAVIFIPQLGPETRCLLLMGVNVARSIPMFWSGVQEMQKLLGLKVIVVDPRDTLTARGADIWLRPKLGTDAALMLGMIRTIIDEDLHDKEFIDKWCHGFDQLVERVQEYPVEKVAEITGVPADSIREAARVYATTKPAQILHLTGIEEQPNATQSLHARYILPGITGNIDIQGGDMMMDVHPTARMVSDLDLRDMMSKEQQDKLIGADKFPLFSWRNFRMIEESVLKVSDRKPNSVWLAGFAHPPSTFEAMLTGEPYPVKAMFTVAKNPLTQFPNARKIYEALMKLDLHVAMDIFMAPACRIADYVLPAACCFEKPWIYGVEIFPFLYGGEAAIEPMYERKPEYYLWRELGIRLGQEEYWPWKNLDEAYDWILEPLGMTFNEFMAGDRKEAPPLPEKKYEAKGFGTPTGKFELYSTILEKLGRDPLPSYIEPETVLARQPDLVADYPLTMIAGTRCRFYHSQGRQLDSLRKKSPDPMALINSETGTQLGIAKNDWMWVETPIGKAKFKCDYSEDLAPEVVQAEHGWWFPEDDSVESIFRSNANAIMDDDLSICDTVSGAYILRGQPCKAYKA